MAEANEVTPSQQDDAPKVASKPANKRNNTKGAIPANVKKAGATGRMAALNVAIATHLKRKPLPGKTFRQAMRNQGYYVNGHPVTGKRADTNSAEVQRAAIAVYARRNTKQ